MSFPITEVRFREASAIYSKYRMSLMAARCVQNVLAYVRNMLGHVRTCHSRSKSRSKVTRNLVRSMAIARNDGIVLVACTSPPPHTHTYTQFRFIFIQHTEHYYFLCRCPELFALNQNRLFLTMMDTLLHRIMGIYLHST